jgi:hypothetical protein
MFHIFECVVPISEIGRPDRRRFLNEARSKSSMCGLGVCLRFFGLFRPSLIKLKEWCPSETRGVSVLSWSD